MRCRFVVDLHLLNEIFQNLIKKEPQEQQQQQQPTEKFIRKSIILRSKTLFSSVLFRFFFRLSVIEVTFFIWRATMPVFIIYSHLALQLFLLFH